MGFDFLYIGALGSATLIVGCGSLAVLLAWLPTRRWVKWEARLEALDVTPRAGKYVRMNQHVKARYSYTYGGRRYEATRISVFEVRPRLFNGYEPTTLRLLDEATIVEESITIKLDPAHPQRAILLDPPVRGQLLSGLVVTLLCGVVLAFVVHEDSSSASLVAGWSIAGIMFLISLLTREGATLLVIFSGI